MRLIHLPESLGFLIMAALPAGAQTISIGGDVYAAGDAAGSIEQAARDIFAAGPAVRVTSGVGQDAHLAGFSVEHTAPTGGDLYAAGGDLRLNGSVGGDLTAFGFSLVLGEAATMQGNARVAGGSVSIAAPVHGALLASGGAVTLDAPVGGDAWITTDRLEFGPAARIDGVLHLTAPPSTVVPERVAPPDRVIISPYDRGEMDRHMPFWAEDWMPHEGKGQRFPGLLGMSVAALLTLGFLFATGAIFLGAMPRMIEALRVRAATRPWLTMALGVIGLSGLVGIVPVAAATLIGLPLVPIAILALILLWTLGYLLGVYVAAFALLEGLRSSTTPRGLGARLLALGLGLVIAALLNFVPLLGWMANLTLGFLGIGAMALASAERLRRVTGA